MTQISFHETSSFTDGVKSGSNRSFGIVFAVVFAIIGLFPLWYSENIKVWALFVAATFLVLAFILPKILAPLNRIWFLFGILLHKFINPLIMGLIFFLVFTPFSSKKCV